MELRKLPPGPRCKTKTSLTEKCYYFETKLDRFYAGRQVNKWNSIELRRLPPGPRCKNKKITYWKSLLVLQLNRIVFTLTDKQMSKTQWNCEGSRRGSGATRQFNLLFVDIILQPSWIAFTPADENMNKNRWSCEGSPRAAVQNESFTY